MKIFVENLAFVGHHGVFEQERREGRRFRVDLAVELEEPAAVRTDRVDHTLDYRQLAQLVMEVGQGDSLQLVERMGDAILARVFERFPDVHTAELTLRKHATGVPGDPEWVGVEMTRHRD